MKKQWIVCLVVLLLTGCAPSAAPETGVTTVQTISTQPPVQQTTEEITAETAAEETLPEQIENTFSQYEEVTQQQKPTEIPEETKPAENEPAETAPAEQSPATTKPPTGSDTTGTFQSWIVDETVIRFHQDEITIPVRGVNAVGYTYRGTGKVIWLAYGGVKVDSSGKITALEEGVHTVCVSDGVYAAVLKVIVPEQEKPKGDIWFEQSTLTIQQGDSKLVSVKGDLTGGYVTYTSSNPSVVTMSGEFLLAVWEGTAVITASHGGRTATMTVTVTRHPDTIYLDMSPLSLTLKVGEIFNGMEWDYNGKGKLRWSSSDSSVARVDAYGNIEGVSEGTCTIWLADEMRAEGCKVTVVPNPDVPYATAMKTGNFSQPLYDGVVKYVGEQMTFDAWVVPEKAKPAISVSSSNRDVVGYWTEWASEAEDSNRIHLIFSAPGTAKITLCSVDGKVTKTFQIIVEEAP